jgi:hypothetical protein
MIHVLFRISICSSLGSIVIWGFRKIKQTIDTEKCLISIIWSVNGIHSLLDLPKCIAYNSILFCNSIVPDSVKSIRAHNRRKILKSIMVYLNDICPHNSRKSTECLEQFRTRRVSHQVYSPDRALSDFFLFVCEKLKLPGVAIRNREDQICEIWCIFEEIPKVTFIFVYVSWIKLLKWMIIMGTIFVNKQKIAGYYSEISEKKLLNKLFDPPRSLIYSARECPLNPIPFI